MKSNLRVGCLVTHKDAPRKIFRLAGYGVSVDIIAYIKQVYNNDAKEVGDLELAANRPGHFLVMTHNLSVASLATILQIEQ